MSPYKLFCIFCFMLICLPSHAQTVRNLDIRDGLSNNTVTSIYKDNMGLMWFGTLDGLNQYDGYTFRRFGNLYRDTTTLPNDNVMSLMGDVTGNLWVGTQDGLAVLDKQELKFSQVYYKDRSGKRKLIKGQVSAICRTSGGTIFLATARYGLLKATAPGIASPVPLRLNNRLLLGDYTAAFAFLSKAGELWVTVDNVGLCKYDPFKNQLNVENRNMLYCSSITGSGTDLLLLGAESGLFCFDKVKRKLSKVNMAEYTNSKIDGITVSGNDVYVATDGYGVIKLSVINGNLKVVSHFDSKTLSSNSVYTIFIDELNRIWIGTFRGGIDIFDEKRSHFQTVKQNPNQNNGLVSNFCFAACEAKDGRVWIGTDGGGLSIWDRKANTFDNHIFKSYPDQAFNENYITEIVKDNHDDMWLGTYGPGVLRYNHITRVFENIKFSNNQKSNRVWRLKKDSSGVIWAGCMQSGDDNTLYYFSASRKVFVPAQFKIRSDIVSIADDGHDGLYLGTTSGLLHANKTTGIDRTIDFGMAVRSLHLTRDGSLWIGTYGRGIFQYRPATGQLRNYTEKNGLCNNKVLNIEEDRKGYLWMSTNFGLSKLDPITGVFENFYATDGLQSNQFYFNASTRLSDGQLIFGGLKGFNIFNPESIPKYHDFPKLIITGLRIANTPVSGNSQYVSGHPAVYAIDRVKLPYEKAVLSIDFAALEYSLPEKIRYAYMLVGRDKAWINLSNQRSLNYSQLDAGTYVLKIRSTNSSGIWNQNEKLVYITVSPPWYRSWIAYILYISFFAAILAAYLAYHHKQTKLRYDIKLAKEVNDKKLAFFTNISHELRTPLTLIVNPIKELMHSNGKNFDLIDLSTVYRNARRLLSLVDQLLLFRATESEVAGLNPAWINVKDVCHEVFLCFNNQVHNKKIAYELIDNDVETCIYADREKLEIVLFNLLSNAVKYTPDYGCVTLEIASNEDHVEISVRDSGKGIPKGVGNKIFEKFYRISHDKAGESGFGIGLYLAWKYMEIHRGELSYENLPEGGTEFKMILPKSSIPATAAVDTHAMVATGKTGILDELILEETSTLQENEAGDDLIITSNRLTSEKQSVLLIDDNKEFRNYLKRILKNDYLIREADTVEQGFELLLNNEPDIVVCDVLLEGTSGVEFCSKIKDSPSFSHIPVILLTGSSSPEIKLKGIECGADDYITKPFEKDLLIARIKSTLKGRVLLRKFFFNEITLKQNQLKVPAEFSDFIKKCIDIVESHLGDEAFTTQKFTKEIGMSRSKLFRLIKSVSGLSIAEFIRYIKLRKAAQMMIETDMQIKEVVYKVGFNDHKHFREQFNKLFEMNPSEFIRRYKNPVSENKIKALYRPFKQSEV